MIYDKLNTFMLNNLENDKSGCAVLLSGKWESGKSFYIREKQKKYRKL